MANKVKSSAEADDNALLGVLRSSAHLIWQAGLGAFSKAQEEGDKLFASLIKAASELQQRRQGAQHAPDFSATQMANPQWGSWDGFDYAFEDRLARALRNIGLPTHDDIKALSAQIEILHNMIAALPGHRAAAATVAATRSAPESKTPAAKRGAGARSKAVKEAAPSARSGPGKRRGSKL